MPKLFAAAQKLLTVNLNVKKAEKVVVVTDRQKCRIFSSVCKAVNDLGCTLVEVHISPNRLHSEPLPKFSSTFNSADVIIGITDKSITHCPETTLARKHHGTRVITMVQVNEELFLKAMSADRKKISSLAKKLSRRLKSSKLVTLTTKSGANFTVRVDPKAVSIDNGDSTKRGSVNNVPFGEVALLPISAASGTVSIDYARNHIMPRDKARVVLKSGKIVDWTETAKSFVHYLKKADGSKALRIVELGFGVNPAHKSLRFSIIHDEKIIGSVHVAFGGFGVKRKCKIHEDVIILKPTVWFDSRMVIKNGKIL
ncbi:MAG: hypothetical protein V1837_02135 [Candidatus Woesearchaeota archaeon]